MQMSKEFVWCKLYNKKCVEPNVEGWNCGCASQSANDCCKDYKRVEQKNRKI